MKAVIQRVAKAVVSVDKKIVGKIGKGLVVFIGISREDTKKEVDWMVEKTVSLRIFADKNNKMNLSVKEIAGSVLAVSQFTLYGDCQKGRRPSFERAAEPKLAERLYNLFVEKLKNRGIKTQTGKFGAMMKVNVVNNGPVTVIIESR